MINNEEQMMNINYKEQTEKWRGFKEIKVRKIVEEDD